MVNASTILVNLLLLLSVFAKGLGQPHGELTFLWRIFFGAVVASVVLFLGMVLLYWFQCGLPFYVVPCSLVVMWLIGFVAVMTPKPHFWGYVTFENRTTRVISTDKVSSIRPGDNIGCSGVDFGNSPTSLPITWWYGNTADKPSDAPVLNVEYPANSVRGGSLTIIFEEGGKVRLTAREIRNVKAKK